MKAKVIGFTLSKGVQVKVRKNYLPQILDLSENERVAYDFKVGDVVEVKLEANNPYLVVVNK